MRPPLVAAAIRAQRGASVAALRSLAPARWEEPGAGGRTPRELAAHLLVVDAALRRGRVGTVTRIPPEQGQLIGVNPAAGARWAALAVGDLLDTLSRSGERLSRRVALLRTPVARVPVRGPAGPASLLDVLAWRVFDEWVRVGDLPDGGDPTADHLDVERATVLAEAVLAAVPRRVLPRVPRTTGVARLVVELGGLVTSEEVGEAVGPRRTWGMDFARRHYGPRVTAPPDVVVRLTAPALALVASGRAAWRTLPERVLRLDGDGDLGADLLDALAPVSTEQSR